MILLTAYFESPTIRAMALKAAADIHGEDGWAVGSFQVPEGRNVEYTLPRLDFVEGKGYAADINCSEIQDAVNTWAGLFIAFARAYGHALRSTEIVAEYKEVN